MLSVSKLHPGRGAYYLEPVALGVETPGRWSGAGGRELDLGPVVGAEELQALLEGRNPGDRSPLGVRRMPVKVSGFDLTFAAPKSVSILGALAEPEVAVKVLAAHQSALRAALDYVESHALAVRPSRGGEQIPEPAQTLYASFDHRTSRAQDPHLHSHVLVVNLGLDRDGTWRSIDGRGVYAHRGAAEALYHAQLRHDMTTALGVSWGPLRGGRADVLGIGEPVRRAFSTRQAQIESELESGGLTGGYSWRARRVAAHVTRAERDLSVDREDLVTRWRGRAAEAGLGPRRLEAVLDRVPARPIGTEITDEDAIGRAVLARRGPEWPFARRHAVREWASLQAHGAPSVEVEGAVDRYLARDELVSVHAGYRDAPGVGERRRMLPERLRSNEIAKMLERRGMDNPELSPACRRQRGFERGEPGPELGLGFG
ncbi:MAG: MobF family relaxase [Acidimicrobiales bacterium]